MALTPGTHLGPYEITNAIGAGGMGEVYKARDTRLDRIVAIKILPAGVAGDPDLRARFQREAHAVAALNHPHICTLYDIGREDNVDFLVMEYLEGETLAARLARVGGAAAPPLRIEEVLRYAIEIASALDAAHRQHIVHRDLKPGNVMLTKTGAKLLDFGLAKLRHAETGAVAGMSAAPTMSAPLTGQGAILGTLQYMAPEQVEGKEADARTDIFAFGEIVYEMATGKRAFEGKSHASLIAAILDHEPPPIAATRPLTPPALDRIVKTCLAKDPDDRWQSARDLLRELKWIADVGSQADIAVPQQAARATRRERLAWSAVVLLLAVAAIALGTLAYLNRGSGATDALEMRLEISTPGGSLTYFALSPDARSLVYQATVDGKTQLWLRRFDTETAQPLPGTDGGSFPFWSPDSRSVGFFATGQLKQVDIATGLAQTVANAPRGTGGAWNRDGIIVFSPTTNGPLYRVGANGGRAVEATRLDAPGQRGHRYPTFLPDGRHFLFFATGTPESRGVYLGAVDATDTRRLFDAESAAVFSPPDRVLFGRQDALVAQRLDLGTFSPIGDPMAVAGRVVWDPAVAIFRVAVSPSSAGPIAYRQSPEERQLTWLDRSGRKVGALGGPDTALPSFMRLSPDGSTVALARVVAGNQDVCLMDTARGVLRRFTFDAAADSEPAWSPDGTRVVFESYRNGVLDLYEKRVGGDGSETLLQASSESKNPMDWSPDGRFILHTSQSIKTASDLWALPLDGDRKPSAVAQTPFSESNGRFSPDGRWIAYTSNESGRTEIYVQPFPGPGGKSQVSTNGGTYPEWRRDGRELFYLAQDRMMAVPIAVNGTRLVAGTPVALFEVPSLSGFRYAVSPDGQRFLVNSMTKEASPITILLNWKGFKK